VNTARSVLTEEPVECVVCLHEPPTINGVGCGSALPRLKPTLPILLATESEQFNEAIQGEPTDVIELSDGRLNHAVATNRIETLTARDCSSTVSQRSLNESWDRVRRLHQIMTDTELTFREQTRELLDLGSEWFGLSIGFLSRTDAETDDFEIIEAHGDHELLQPGRRSNLSDTYCQNTVDADTEGPITIYNATASGLADDPAYQRFGLNTYIGTEIVFDGDHSGTLCFVDENPRQEAFSVEDRLIIDDKTVLSAIC
jgi:hypothetical protein